MHTTDCYARFTGYGGIARRISNPNWRFHVLKRMQRSKGLAMLLWFDHVAEVNEMTTCWLCRRAMGVGQWTSTCRGECMLPLQSLLQPLSVNEYRMGRRERQLDVAVGLGLAWSQAKRAICAPNAGIGTGTIWALQGHPRWGHGRRGARTGHV